MAANRERSYAKILLEIADDDDLEARTISAQWLYFRVLLPDRSLNACGVCDWRPTRLTVKAVDATLDVILAAATEAEHSRMVLFDLHTEEALARSYIRRDQLLRNPKTAAAVIKAYQSIVSKSLRAAVVTEVRRARDEHPEYSSWTHKDTAEGLTNLMGRPDAGQVPYVVQYTYPSSVQITNGIGNQNGEVKSVGITNTDSVQITNPDTYADNQRDNQSDSVRIPCHLTPNTSHLTPEGGYVSTEGHQGDDPDPEPPRRCPKHEDVDDPPLCGACAEARRGNDRWNLAKRKAETERANAEAAERIQAQRIASAMAIASCELCDDDGYRGGGICHHNPGQDDTNRRGAELVRAAMRGEVELPPEDPEDQ